MTQRRRPSWRSLALLLVLASACAAPSASERSSQRTSHEPSAVEPTRGKDAGARVWVAWHEAREGREPERSVLELLEQRDFAPASRLACPSPLLTCEGAPATAAATGAPAERTKLTFYWREDEPLTDENVPRCTAEGLVTPSGRIDCDEIVYRGLVLEPRGDELFVRLTGRWWYGGAATSDEMERVLKVTVEQLGQPAELTLTRADPLEIVFEGVAEPSKVRSSEARRFAPLVEPLERAAGQLPELGLEAVQALVVERGIDPRTLPLEVAYRIYRHIGQFRVYALRMSPSERTELAREVVENELKALESPDGA